MDKKMKKEDNYAGVTIKAFQGDNQALGEE